jgi:PAS domain S-box-containing protein
MNDKLTTWALVLSCVLLVGVGALMFQTIRSLSRATQGVSHSQRISGLIEQLRFDLKAVESDSRGFLLLGKEAFSEELAERKKEAGKTFAELDSLMTDNPRQRERLEDARGFFSQRVAMLEEAVALRRSGEILSRDGNQMLREGEEAMARAMTALDALARQESSLLEERSARAGRRQTLVYFAIVGGFSLSMLLAGWPMLTLRRELVEREKSRRQLIAASERIQDLYNTAPCGYFSLNASGQIGAMNDTMRHWLGLERPGLNRLRLDDLCVAGHRAAANQWPPPGRKSGTREEREMAFQKKDGSVFPVWLTAVRADGEADGWRLTAVDITERKRAERLVEEARDEAELIVNTVRQPLLVLKEDLRVASANRAFYALFETTGEAIVGKPLAEICEGQWAVPELLRALDDVGARQLAVENFEVSLSVARKGRRLFEINARKLHRPGSRTEMTLLAIEDVTERRRRDDSHRQFRALFESLPGRYLVLTPDLVIVAVSDAYLTMTLTTREQIVGREIFEVFPDSPADVESKGSTTLRASFNRVLQTGVIDMLPVLHYDIARPDGVFEERYWSPVNSPVFGSGKQIEYIIHRAEDVTEFVLQQRRAEKTVGAALMGDGTDPTGEKTEMLVHSRELGAANETLRALNDELEAFSYSVSHDLRAPLRHIAGFGQMLAAHAGDALDQKGRRYLTTITDAAERMGHLIDDLLLFSRMGRAEMRRQRVALDDVVGAVIDGMKLETAGRAIAWDVSGLRTVQGDLPMLRQVFVNLIGNAVKYTRKKADATIVIGSMPADPGFAKVFVRDNGAGFDMKYAPKLFGVFQRLHSAAEFEGTGVGLAIVRRIVQRHGGNVWAEGAPGEGATFFLTLPLEHAKTNPPF